MHKSLKTKRAASALVAAALASAAFAPCAFAATPAPSATMGQSVESQTASTSVYLQVDDSQLSVTAPTEIHFTAKADGTLIVPTDAYIENDSIFDVAVKSFAVADTAAAKGVAASSFDAAQDKNVYKVKANGVDFAVSAASLDASWNMKQTDGAQNSGADKIALAFTDGAIKNIDTAKADFSSEQQIGTVTWTFGAQANA